MKTILVAEDDKKFATALTVRLEAAGYHVLSRPDGFRSFLAAAGIRPDLILMDISMPVADGLAVAEELKEINLQNIPIIFMTASKRTSVKERAKELGAVAFFEKPFSSDALLKKIAQALNASTECATS